MKKIQRELKNNEGITLIALVVTIIILLILAGVAINMALGENGLFERAKIAKENHEIGEEKEAIELAMSSLKIEKTRESIMSNTEETLITPEELKAEMDKGAPKPASVEVGENEGELQVRFDERRKNRSYDVTQNGEITLKKVLTPEEASQIIDVVFDIRADENDESKRIPYILTAGGDVIRTTRSEGNVFSKVNLTGDIVTKNGLRKKMARKYGGETSYFIDNKGKIYLYKNDVDSSIVCLNDVEGSQLQGKNIVDVYEYGDDILMDIDGNIYEWYYNWDDGTLESACINDIEGSALNGKNVVDLYGDDYGHYVAKDNSGKIYEWEYDSYRELLKSICINDVEGSVLNGKNIDNAYLDNHSNRIAVDNNGKLYEWYYNWNNETLESVCINDIEGSALNGNNIVDVYGDSHGDYVAKDSNGKIYVWYYNWNNKILETECLNDVEENVLNGKNIVKVYVTMDEDDIVLISQDINGNIYESYLKDGTFESVCINDIEGSALNGENIVEMYEIIGIDGSERNISRDINGKIYIWYYNLNNLTLESVCLNDVEGSVLQGKNIVNVCDTIKYGSGKNILLDIDGNIYEWYYNWDDRTLESVCINDKENSKLKGKKIRKVVKLDASVCYITKDNECYIYSWYLPIDN